MTTGLANADEAAQSLAKALVNPALVRAAELGRLNKALMRPLDPALVKRVAVGGQDESEYIDVGSVKRALYEVLGPLGWSHEIKSVETVAQEKIVLYDDSGNVRMNQITGEALAGYNVCASAMVRLVIGDPREPLAVHEEIGHGLSLKQRELGRALQHARGAAVSNALKKAAEVLGPSFGLALYVEESERGRMGMTESPTVAGGAQAPSVPSSPVNASGQQETAPPTHNPPPAEGQSASGDPLLTIQSWTQLRKLTDASFAFGRNRDALAPMDVKAHVARLARERFGDPDFKRVAEAFSMVELPKGAQARWEQLHYFTDAVEEMLAPPDHDDTGQRLPSPTQNIAGGEAPMVNVNETPASRPPAETLPATGQSQVAAEQAKNPSDMGVDLSVAFAGAEKQAALTDPKRPCGDLAPLPPTVQALVKNKGTLDLIPIKELNDAGLKPFMEALSGGANAEAGKVRKGWWIEAGFTPTPDVIGPARWNVEQLAQVLRLKIEELQKKAAVKAA